MPDIDLLTKVSVSQSVPLGSGGGTDMDIGVSPRRSPTHKHTTRMRRTMSIFITFLSFFAHFLERRFILAQP